MRGYGQEELGHKCKVKSTECRVQSNPLGGRDGLPCGEAPTTLESEVLVESVISLWLLVGGSVRNL